jgi:hypothetical protein
MSKYLDELCALKYLTALPCVFLNTIYREWTSCEIRFS